MTERYIAQIQKRTNIISPETGNTGNVIQVILGDLVTIYAQLFCPNLSANTWTTIVNINSNRPSNTVPFPIVTFANDAIAYGQLGTDGRLRIYPTVALASNAQVYFNFSY